MQNILYHSFPLGKSHESDLIKKALHRESLALFSKLNKIKELLSNPETRMKINRELFQDRQTAVIKKSCWLQLSSYGK